MLKTTLSYLFQSFGYSVYNNQRFRDNYLKRFDEDVVKIFTQVSDFTMTGIERVNSLIKSVYYLQDNSIEGDIVECGVWRGGSIMASILALQNKNKTDVKIWLYDTFEGMSEPTKEDVDYLERDGNKLLKEHNESKESSSVWAIAFLEEVKSNISSLGYDIDKVSFIKGKVEETIPNNLPEKISLLRLDTDWYESTKHELEHLFPKLSRGGVLIIDDYGHWKGSRKACDEYFTENNLKPFLHRIDQTGIVMVKS